MSIFQGNTRKKDLGRLHFDDEPTYPSSNLEHYLRNDNNIPCKVDWKIYRDKVYFQEERTSQKELRVQLS